MNDGLITLTEFTKQVKNIEHVNIVVVNYNTHKIADGNIKVPPYPYLLPMNGRTKQEDFINERIYPCLKDFFNDDYFVFLVKGE